MKRILVIGCPGSGKTTLSQRLGDILQIPVIHLDTLYWKPGWVETGKDEWIDQLRNVMSNEAWILDGNYSGTLPERLGECDAVVFLDVSRILCVWRVLKRSIWHHGKVRSDMAEGCPERLDLSFLLWVWNYRNRSRPKILNLLRQCHDSKKVIYLRSRHDVEEFLVKATA